MHEADPRARPGGHEELEAEPNAAEEGELEDEDLDDEDDDLDDEDEELDVDDED